VRSATSPAPLPILAAVVAMIGVVLTLVSLGPDYFEDGLPFRDITSELVYYVVFALGLIAAAALLVAGRATRATGAAMLVAMTVTFVGSRTVNGALALSDFQGLGAGVVIDLIAYSFVWIAALLAVIGLILDRSPVWAPGGRAWFAALGAATGFLLAVSYSMNIAAFPFSGPGNAQGSPFMPVLPRGLWGPVLVVAALVALPALVALARAPIAIGLAAGLGVFMVAELLHRVLRSYGEVNGRDPGLDPIEGTWLFLLFSLFVGGALAVILAVPARSQDSVST